MSKSSTIDIVKENFLSSLSSSSKFSEKYICFDDAMGVWFKCNKMQVQSYKSETENNFRMDLEGIHLEMETRLKQNNFKYITQWSKESSMLVERLCPKNIINILTQFENEKFFNEKNTQNSIKYYIENIILTKVISLIPTEIFVTIPLYMIIPSIYFVVMVSCILSFARDMEEMKEMIKFAGYIRKHFSSMKNNLFGSVSSVISYEELFYHVLHKTLDNNSLKNENALSFFDHEEEHKSIYIETRNKLVSVKPIFEFICCDRSAFTPPEKSDTQKMRAGKIEFSPQERISISKIFEERITSSKKSSVPGLFDKFSISTKNAPTPFMLCSLLIVCSMNAISKVVSNNTEIFIEEDEKFIKKYMSILPASKIDLNVYLYTLFKDREEKFREDVQNNNMTVSNKSALSTSVPLLFTNKYLRDLLFRQFEKFVIKIHTPSFGSNFYLDICNNEECRKPILIKTVSNETKYYLYLLFLLGSNSKFDIDTKLYGQSLPTNEIDKVVNILELSLFTRDLEKEILVFLKNFKENSRDANYLVKPTTITFTEEMLSNKIGEAEMLAKFYSTKVKRCSDVFKKREDIFRNLKYILEKRTFDISHHSLENKNEEDWIYTIQLASRDTDVLINSLFSKRICSTNDKGESTESVILKMEYYSKDLKKTKTSSKIRGYFHVDELYHLIDQRMRLNVSDSKVCYKLDRVFSVETFCVAMMMGGNDYIEKLGNMGHKKMFSALDIFYPYIGDIISFSRNRDTGKVFVNVYEEEYLAYAKVFYLCKHMPLDTINDSHKKKEVNLARNEFRKVYKSKSVKECINNINSAWDVATKVFSFKNNPLDDWKTSRKNCEWNCNYIIRSSVGLPPIIGINHGWKKIHENKEWERGNVTRITSEDVKPAKITRKLNTKK